MKTPKRPRDPNQLAKFIVDAATGDGCTSDGEKKGNYIFDSPRYPG